MKSALADLNILASNGSDAVPVSNRPGVALTRSGIMIPRDCRACALA